MPISLTTLAHEMLSTIFACSHCFADAVSLSSVNSRLREIWKIESEIILRTLAGNMIPGALERKLGFEILFDLLAENDDGVKLTVEQTVVFIDSVARPVQAVATTLCVSWSLSDSRHGQGYICSSPLRPKLIALQLEDNRFKGRGEDKAVRCQTLLKLLRIDPLELQTSPGRNGRIRPFRLGVVALLPALVSRHA